MAEALAAAGLASSIISFIEFSIEFGKLVRSISKRQGNLPKEFEECHEYIDIVAVWLEDAKRSVQPVSAIVEEDRHLEEAIQKCSQTATELVALLGSLSHGPLPDANISLVGRTEEPLSASRGRERSCGNASVSWKSEIGCERIETM